MNRHSARREASLLRRTQRALNSQNKRNQRLETSSVRAAQLLAAAAERTRREIEMRIQAQQALLAEKESAKQREYDNQCILCAQAAELLSTDDRVAVVIAKGTILTLETNWIPSIKINGRQFQIGRFGIEIDRQHQVLQAKWLEHGSSGEYPFYWLSDGYFCFGRRAEYLLKLVRAGEYLGVVYGMLDSFQHVNQDDYDQILLLYEEIL